MIFTQFALAFVFRKSFRTLAEIVDPSWSLIHRTENVLNIAPKLDDDVSQPNESKLRTSSDQTNMLEQ